MDKEKEFIPIDEVFRPLKHREESDIAGSWPAMKQLLERQLPGAGYRAGRRRMRRFLVPAALLLLLAVGGIYMMRQQDTSDKAPNLADPGTTTNGRQAPSPAGSAMASLEDSAHSVSDKAPLAETSATSPVLAMNNTGAPANHLPPSSGRNHTKVIKETAKDELNRLAAAAGRSNTNNSASEKSIAAIPVTPDSKPAVSSASTYRQPTAQTPPPVIRKEVVLATLYAKTTPILLTLKEQQKEGLLPDNQWKILNKTSEYTLVENQTTGERYKEVRDTITRVTMKTYLTPPGYDRKRHTVTDTQSITQVETIQYFPLKTGKELESESPSTALLASASTGSGALSAASADAIAFVPLESYKVSSKNIGREAVLNLKNTAGGIASLFDGSKKWYGAVIAGANTGIGNPAGFGMQAGVAILFAFAERWILSTEIKYQSAFYNNFQIFDDAKLYEVNKQSVPGGWHYTGTESIIQNTFRIKQRQRIQMPILLSYNLGRISIFAGPEASYYFPLKWSQDQQLSVRPVDIVTSTNETPFSSTELLISDPESFRARFGLGYTAGLSYDFSRKLSLDARVSHTVWDNFGKYEVKSLQNVYRKPTFELSLGFFFGRREKVIYLIDRNN